MAGIVSNAIKMVAPSMAMKCWNPKRIDKWRGGTSATVYIMKLSVALWAYVIFFAVHFTHIHDDIDIVVFDIVTILWLFDSSQIFVLWSFHHCHLEQNICCCCSKQDMLPLRSAWGAWCSKYLFDLLSLLARGTARVFWSWCATSTTGFQRQTLWKFGKQMVKDGDGMYWATCSKLLPALVVITQSLNWKGLDLRLWIFGIEK